MYVTLIKLTTACDGFHILSVVMQIKCDRQTSGQTFGIDRTSNLSWLKLTPRYDRQFHKIPKVFFQY